MFKYKSVYKTQLFYVKEVQKQLEEYYIHLIYNFSIEYG